MLRMVTIGLGCLMMIICVVFAIYCIFQVRQRDERQRRASTVSGLSPTPNPHLLPCTTQLQLEGVCSWTKRWPLRPRAASKSPTPFSDDRLGHRHPLKDLLPLAFACFCPFPLLNESTFHTRKFTSMEQKISFSQSQAAF